MRIFLFLAFLGHTASAPADEIPVPILKAQAQMVSQGICQGGWQEYLAQPGHTVAIDLNRGYKMWVLPCAVWASNPATAVYITVPESNHPDGFITKPIPFLTYRTPGKLFADSVIHNIQWDSVTQSLLAEFHPDGRGMCGMRARYAWDLSYQTFRIVWLAKQDDCKDPSAAWQTLIGSEVN